MRHQGTLAACLFIHNETHAQELSEPRGKRGTAPGGTSIKVIKKRRKREYRGRPFLFYSEEIS